MPALFTDLETRASVAPLTGHGPTLARSLEPRTYIVHYNQLSPGNRRTCLSMQENVVMTWAAVLHFHVT